MRTCTSRAPAFLSLDTIWAVVVPRTMESSTSTRRLPATAARRGESLSVTLALRSAWVGSMKVRPM